MTSLQAPIPNKKRLVTAIDDQAAMLAAKLAPSQLVRLKNGKLYLIKTAAEFGGVPDEVKDLTLNNGYIAVLVEHDHNDLYYTEAEVDALLNTINQAISDNTTAIGGKAASAHNHDDRYYTETEVDQLIADTVANGVQLSNDYTGTRTTVATTEKALSDGLATKANTHSHPYAATSHNHSASNITSGTLSASRLPSASTSAKGAVQLSSSTSSTSTTLAATSSAVKAAYDLAAGKANSSHNHSASNITSGTLNASRLPSASTSVKGAVQLSNSYSGTSQTKAVTEKALSDGLANASAAAGQVGSYAFCTINENDLVEGQNYLLGSTFSGSKLSPSSFQKTTLDTTDLGMLYLSSNVLSGTWELAGRFSRTTFTAGAIGALFRRVA